MVLCALWSVLSDRCRAWGSLQKMPSESGSPPALCFAHYLLFAAPAQSDTTVLRQDGGGRKTAAAGDPGGIFGILRRFPFYTNGYRLVLRRLSASAQQLVNEEGLRIWTEVGVETVLQFLESQACSFQASQLLALPSAFECRMTWADSQLFCSTFWTPLSAPKDYRDGATLLIEVQDQGTSEGTVTGASSHEAVTFHPPPWTEPHVQLFKPGS